MSKKWNVLDKKYIFESSYFNFRSDKCELPNGKIMPAYYTFEFPDWVNIIPITENREFVFIQQYRHSANLSCLEIPGGSMESNTVETPKIAAQRELQEETGYTTNNVISLGSHYPNPALQNNKMHTFIAFNCCKTSELNLDPFEDISVKLLNYTEVKNALFNGKIQNSIISNSVFKAMHYLNENNFMTENK